MNDHCKPIRKKIRSLSRNHSASPAKPSTTNLRQSPRKIFSMQEPTLKDTSGDLTNADAKCHEESPLRRSARNPSYPHIGSISPTKSVLPPPWKKGPKRELPSRDSPRKRTTMEQQSSDIEKSITQCELAQTPSKRRKLETLSTSSRQNTSSFLIALGGPGSPLDVLDHSGPMECQTKSISHPSSPLKQTHNSGSMDLPSSSESESDRSPPRRRFRPVYLENQQWNARDPRLARIWNRAEKLVAFSKAK